MILHFLQLHTILITVISLIVGIILLFFKAFRINGSIIFIISLLIFLMSVYIRNLFLQYLSASVLILFTFIFFYYLCLTLYYSKNKIEFTCLYDGLINPFKSSSLNIDASKLPMLFPGIYFVLKFSLYEKDRAIKRYVSPIIQKSGNKLQFNTIFDRHGTFTIKDFSFVVRDIFGFTELKYVVDFSHSITIYPFYLQSLHLPFFLDKGGEQIYQSVVRETSTDFFENRKYYPGDDTRRINWNIFAHSGELHIREVEKIPPKIGQISILFAPYSENVVEYEYITSLLLSTVNYLLTYNFEIKLYSPARESYTLIDKFKENDFNTLINNSYYPYNYRVKHLSNMIVFASFNEFKRLFYNVTLTTIYSAVSYFDNQMDKSRLLTSFFTINTYDNVLLEAINSLKQFRQQRNKEHDLRNIKNNLQSTITLEVYKITNDFQQ